MIDMRSDTVTKPSGGMKQAILAAELGDDVYGDDPTVAALEEFTATFCGFEAALFVPSGTMSNQIAINVHCSPGDTILAEEGVHTYAYEAGAAAALSGVQFRFVGSGGDCWNRGNLEACHIPDNLHTAPVRLIVVENTHNRGGGRVVRPETLAQIHQFASDYDIATHCDGARIWNAASALGCSEKDLLASFDTASVCFSKGLGAPVGSALLGSRQFIDRARKVRKRLGGGMRQAGVIAAAALYALRHHREDIGRDHLNAQRLVDALRQSPAARADRIEFNYPEPVTNMLYFRIRGIAGDRLNQVLSDSGILANHLGAGWIRLVTHRDLQERDIESAAAILANLSA